MLKNMIARPYWTGLAVVAILAVSLTFAPVQALASSFLGLFRVQQVRVVEINPGTLPDQLGSSVQFEALLSNDVQVEKSGQPIAAGSPSEASSMANIAVRLPSSVEGTQSLKVQPGSTITLKVDVQQIRSVLAEIGRTDIQIPSNLDGSTVTVNVPASVVAQYGQCEFNTGAYDGQRSGPNGHRRPVASNCTTLVQMPSPTISTPPDLDIAQVGQAFLEVLGMSPTDAAHFAQNIDWATTLVLPIPSSRASYQDVTVDGGSGTLIQESNGRGSMLIWVKNGIVYGLAGPGDNRTMLDIANSIK